MKKDRAQQAVAYAKEALFALREAIVWVNESTELHERKRRIDAVAKRFEVSFEYVWKAMQAVARYKGQEVDSPRDALQAAHALHWIDDIESWANFLEARNCGVHDYFGLGSEEYFAVATTFLPASETVIQKLETVF